MGTASWLALYRHVILSIPDPVGEIIAQNISIYTFKVPNTHCTMYRINGFPLCLLREECMHTFRCNIRTYRKIQIYICNGSWKRLASGKKKFALMMIFQIHTSCVELKQSLSLFPRCYSSNTKLPSG